MNIEDNPLVEVAMQIILHAGDAREKATEAIGCAKQSEFEQARICMEQAKQMIIEAHHAQTEVIQKEASGIGFEINLLFIHAQDTLMTIKSEVKLTKELIDLYEMISNKVRN